MKLKLIAIIVIVGGVLIGSYYYYHHNYVETLMLSEIVGHTDNPVVNIAINLGDFDTDLSRHDINVLKDNKDYWLARIQEVESIENSDLKEQASTELLSDMMEDPVLKKICSGVLQMGTSTAFGLIEIVL